MKDRIKKIRKNVGLTQKEFAERLGLKQNTIATYEIGRIGISDTVILSICREFNVNEKWLRTGEGEMFIIPEDETAALVSDLLEEPENDFFQAVVELVRTYKQLSPESQNVLCDFGKLYLENLKNRKA